MSVSLERTLTLKFPHITQINDERYYSYWLDIYNFACFTQIEDGNYKYLFTKCSLTPHDSTKEIDYLRAIVDYLSSYPE